MRLLVVGAGATGGYFGGRLAEAGRDVTFLVRPARAEQLKAKGLAIVSPHGDVTLTPRVATADALGAPYDAILLAVKAYTLDSALKDMAPAVGADTVIVPLLNGMKHLDVIAASFGRDKLAGGLCKIAVALDPEGRILHLSQFHDLAYGELGGARSERIETLDRLMHNAVFDARLSSNIEKEMWEKWMMLATLAGATCLMRGSIGDIASVPGGVAFVERYFDEVVAVATAEGHAPDEAYMKATRALLTAQGSTLTSSMHRDVLKNAPIEADQIIGDLLQRGAKAKVHTPLLSAVYANLRVYERLRQASPSA